MSFFWKFLGWFIIGSTVFSAVAFACGGEPPYGSDWTDKVAYACDAVFVTTGVWYWLIRGR